MGVCWDFCLTSSMKEKALLFNISGVSPCRPASPNWTPSPTFLFLMHSEQTSEPHPYGTGAAKLPLKSLLLRLQWHIKTFREGHIGLREVRSQWWVRQTNRQTDCTRHEMKAQRRELQKTQRKLDHHRHTLCLHACEYASWCTGENCPLRSMF